MKNLPIKKDIEDLLNPGKIGKFGIYPYSGIYRIEGRSKYLKLSSDILASPVRIPLENYKDPHEALEDVEKCVKVFKKFIEIGLYPPETGIAIYEDKGSLALIVIMPELDVDNEFPDYGLIEKKLENLEKKFNISLRGDLEIPSNWGYDKKRKEWYAHDLHITLKGYEEVLKIADKMEIK